MIQKTTAIAALLLLLSACSGDPYARTGVFFSQSQAQERIDTIKEKTLEEELALLDAQKENKSLTQKRNKLLAENKRIKAQIANCEDPTERQQLLEKKAQLERELQALTDLTD